jgi:acetolactate synthase-1/2/3 large subunit
MTSVATRLVDWLRAMGTQVLFGIPGVHTIELYRALPASGIRHVTPRNEAGAGFMADGYARVSGRFGVALVITGPGMTNILTPMAQAQADSVPMLVISGVNRRETLAKGLGYLHELPDQHAMIRALCPSFHLEDPQDLPGILGQIETLLTTGRPGPVHLQIPLDLMAAPAPGAPLRRASLPALPLDIAQANDLLAQARRPVILAGGGCRGAAQELAALAERLGAPVILTSNARGLMHGHPLAVPASPSLGPVRDLIRGADRLLVLGSELGPTDCDMYDDGGFPDCPGMIRVDIDPLGLTRHRAQVTLCGDSARIVPLLTRTAPAPDGPARAAATRTAALAALPPGYDAQVAALETLRAQVPGAIMVGDSTQIVYAGNLWYDHDRPGGWFNSATGYGALGYATGAAVGAALAAPQARILCLTGDGGLMFNPGEMMSAAQEGLNITFLVLNNHGFGEIADAMRAAGADVLGCTPSPPDLGHLARACGLPFARTDLAGLDATAPGPRLIEVSLPPVTP